MSDQDRFRRLLPFKQESREAIVGQMLRCRNQVATSVAVKLNSTRTVVDCSWGKVDSKTPAASNREQLSMGTDETVNKGCTQRSTVSKKIERKDEVE